jgi:L-fuculose-phosphate aldolase
MIKEKIIEIGKRLYLKNLTVGTSGNISIKTDEGIYITASGTALGNLSKEGIVLIDFDGKEKNGGKASSEKMLHVEIYKQRPDIKAIIHTHPAYLTTFASCHKTLNEPIMSENILYFEEIPVAEYAMPSSMELVHNTVKYLDKHDVVMMANHGAVVCANDIETAFLKMETAEYYAQVTLNTKIIGGAKYLSDKDVKDLINLKNNIH